MTKKEKSGSVALSVEETEQADDFIRLQCDEFAEEFEFLVDAAEYAVEGRFSSEFREAVQKEARSYYNHFKKNYEFNGQEYEWTG